MDMRQQDKIIIWPAYFDSAKTRKEGRRVSKSLALPFPKIQEMKEAAAKMGFECELVEGVGYPKTAWMKTGMLLVKKKKETKEKIIVKIAQQLPKIRAASVPMDKTKKG
jgi:signal recognition particle subunit SRP19